MIDGVTFRAKGLAYLEEMIWVSPLWCFTPRDTS